MQGDLASSLKYKEKWDVYMSNQREPYELNEMEYAVLQDAILKGVKGVIQFDRFMLNTSFIVSSFRRIHELKDEYKAKQLKEPDYMPPTPEQMEKFRKNLEAFKIKMGIKMST
jgi:hypothetical protein